MAEDSKTSSTRTGSWTPATSVVDYQWLIGAEKPRAPASYELRDLGGVWIAYDPRLPVVELKDSGGAAVTFILGLTYSEFSGGFLPAGDAVLDFVVGGIQDVERRVLPALSGLYIAISVGALPRRLYLDHGGGLPAVYSPAERLAGSSPSLLLDEDAYQTRFRTQLHRDVVLKETYGGWLPGTLTAHEGLHRLLANNYLDLTAWSTKRYWPQPGEFDAWRDMDAAATDAATALRDFSEAACREFSVAATLTAGFDSRLLMAGCRNSLDRAAFFTIEAPGTEMDVTVSQRLAAQFGLSHRTMPIIEAGSQQIARWDRAVGNVMLEAPRRTHPTLAQLTDRNVLFTGMYGEVGRCRLYRQDLEVINHATVDARFVVDRLTLPAHPEIVENIRIWLTELEGQPNSVILDLAFHELKFGSWAMGQRAFTNSVKLNLLPFAQRRVFNAFIGVRPQDKRTDRLFWKMIGALWPEIQAVPINKYGDIRDRLTFWKKLTNPYRLRRFLRDRFARKDVA